MRNKVKARLVTLDHSILLHINIIYVFGQAMPRYLRYQDRIFEFDSGLQHCGERYNEIEVTDVTPYMVVTYEEKGIET